MLFRSQCTALFEKLLTTKTSRFKSRDLNDGGISHFSRRERRAGYYRLKSFIIILFLFLFCFKLFSLNYENVLLRDIAEKIDAYRNKEITLKLRFKIIDYTFEKITFYDKKNIDIIFDISKYRKDKKFKERTLNLHEGMEYLVSFTVKDVGNSGEISGDLTGFTPCALLELPEGNKKGT